MYKRTTISLPSDLVAELGQKSLDMHQKKSRIVANALMSYFDEIEGTIAKERLARIKSGDEKPIPAEQVWKELGL